MYNAADRKDIRRAEKAAALVDAAKVEFLRAAMGTVQGRAWFHDLLAACRIFADPFSGEALIEAFNKGQRNVGLMIFADILLHCPDQYVLMMRESNDGSTAYEQPRGSDRGRDVEGLDDAEHGADDE